MFLFLDSAKSTADESVNNAFIADNTDEDKRKSTTDTELKELRVKMSNDEKYKSDLISENSTLKSELEATLKRTLQFEAECKALNERLAEVS